MRFYVYELRDELGAVFYVGKGSGRRMYEHKHKANAGQQTRRAERIREILAPGGNLVSLCAAGPKQRAAFASSAAEWIDLPAGTFKGEGTSVAAAIVAIQN